MLHPIFMWTNALSCRSEIKIYSGPAARSEAVRANKSWLGETAGAKLPCIRIRQRVITGAWPHVDAHALRCWQGCYMVGCDLTLKAACEHCKQSAWPQRRREWHYDLAGVLQWGMQGLGGTPSVAFESLCWEVLINTEEDSDTCDLWAGNRLSAEFVISIKGGSTSEAPWLKNNNKKHNQVFDSLYLLC